VCVCVIHLTAVDVTVDPGPVASSLSVDTTIAAAIAPARDADQVVATRSTLDGVWATRVTLAGVLALADLTGAHLQVGVDHGTEASNASSIGQVKHSDVHQVARDAAASEESAPTASVTLLALMVLAAVRQADWNNVVVVDVESSGKLHQRDVVSQGGRAVLRMVNDLRDAHGLGPRLMGKTIVNTAVEQVDSWVHVTEWAVSSRDVPLIVDDGATADEATVTTHGANPAVVAYVGLNATDDLIVGVALMGSGTAAVRVDATSGASNGAQSEKED